MRLIKRQQSLKESKQNLRSYQNLQNNWSGRMLKIFWHIRKVDKRKYTVQCISLHQRQRSSKYHKMFLVIRFIQQQRSLKESQQNLRTYKNPQNIWRRRKLKIFWLIRKVVHSSMYIPPPYIQYRECFCRSKAISAIETIIRLAEARAT